MIIYSVYFRSIFSPEVINFIGQFVTSFTDKAAPPPLLPSIFVITTPVNVNLSEKVFLSLENDQVIKNMQVIDKSKILITIYNGKDIEGIIFDIENQKIIQTINK